MLSDPDSPVVLILPSPDCPHVEHLSDTKKEDAKSEPSFELFRYPSVHGSFWCLPSSVGR